MMAQDTGDEQDGTAASGEKAPDAAKENAIQDTLNPATIEKECPSSMMVSNKSSDIDEDDMEVSDLTEAERYVTFTDAVIAIAMTLLILPLMESASDISGGEEDVTVQEFFSENSNKVGSFFISFWIVSHFWTQHDKLFRYVGHLTRVLVRLNMLWTAGIVFLPVTTSLLNATPSDSNLGVVCYISTLLVTRVMGAIMCYVIRNDKRTWKGNRGPGQLAVIANFVYIGLLVIALIISTLLPVVGSYSLLILAFAQILMVIVKRKWPEFRY